MGALPGETPAIVRAIYKSYEDAERQVPRREHLGASSIGKECGRALWYAFRWAHGSDFPGRMLRLFETGHRQEARIVADLRREGVEVLELDPATGCQWRYEDESLGGHFRGSIDGAAKGLPGVKGWALVEFKTSSVKAFKRLKSKGVLKAKPEHFAQMQAYMGWSGLEVAAYFVICKDTDAYYYEQIDFDPKAFEQLSNRARQIVESSEPLTAMYANPMQPPCSWCDAKELCHENKVADVNCRTCVHSTPKTDETGGAWMCEKYGVFLKSDEQKRACDDHVFIPALVPYATPIDSGDGFVLYQIGKKGPRFLNVAADSFPAIDAPHLTSKGLRDLQIMDFDGVPTESELKIWDNAADARERTAHDQ